MRDEEFDRKQRETSADVATDRARVPGKQTLVGAEPAGRHAVSGAPGKATLVSDTTEGRDQVVETEFHVQKARELMARLAQRTPPLQERVLRADLRCHVDDAKRAAAHCERGERGRRAAESFFQPLVEAMPLLERSQLTPDAIAQRELEGSGQRLPFHEEIQRAFTITTSGISKLRRNDAHNFHDP